MKRTQTTGTDPVLGKTIHLLVWTNESEIGRPGTVRLGELRPRPTGLRPDRAATMALPAVGAGSLGRGSGLPANSLTRAALQATPPLGLS